MVLGNQAGEEDTALESVLEDKSVVVHTVLGCVDTGAVEQDKIVVDHMGTGTSLYYYNMDTEFRVSCLKCLVPTVRVIGGN